MNFGNSILKCVVAGAVAVLASAGNSTAATLTAVTDKSIWDGMVSNENLLNFDTPLPADSYTPPALNTLYQFATYSVTLNGMTFSNTIKNSLNQVTNQYLQVSGYNTWGTADYMRGQPATTGQTGNVHIVMPAGGITAFAVNWVTGGSYGTLTVSTATDSTVAMSAASASMGFYGFTFASPVSAIDLSYTNNSSVAAFDNIIMATAGSGTQQSGETPEATTLLLCATGLIFVSKRIASRTSVRA